MDLSGLALLCVGSIVLMTLSAQAQQELLSPCPRYFDYELDDQRQWTGVIKMPAPPLGSTLSLNLRMSLPTRLPTKYAGRIELLGERGDVLQQILNGLNVRYRVYFPLLTPLPQVTAITFNGQLVCSGPGVRAPYVTSISLDHVLYTTNNANGANSNTNSGNTGGFAGNTNFGGSNPGFSNSNPSSGGNSFNTNSGEFSDSGNSGNPFPNNVFLNNHFNKPFSSYNKSGGYPGNSIYAGGYDGSYNFDKPSTSRYPNFNSGNSIESGDKYVSAIGTLQNGNTYNVSTGSSGFGNTATTGSDRYSIIPSNWFTGFGNTNRIPGVGSGSVNSDTNRDRINTSGFNRPNININANAPPTAIGVNAGNSGNGINVVNQNRGEVGSQQPASQNNDIPNPENFADPPKVPAPEEPSEELPIGGEPVCGMARTGGVNQLVIGGAGVTRGEWPWLVALYVKKPAGLDYVCGGSLVSDRHVITAAHCLHQKNNPRVKETELVVKVGAFNLQDWTDELARAMAVTKYHLHPGYDGNLAFDADIAVLVMKPVKFSRYVVPACLWDDDPDLSKVVGQKGAVIGWGRDENGLLSTPEPRVLEAPIVSTEACRGSNPQFFQMTSNTTFCAGSRNGKGPCNGDSGGGLYLKKNGYWVLRGIVSTSIKDPLATTCDLKEYVVYTDTAQYGDWIKQIIAAG